MHAFDFHLRASGRLRARRLAAWGILALAGCAAPDNHFHITAFADPAGPQEFSERFREGWYALDPYRNWEFVFEMDPAMPGAGPPLRTDDEDAGEAVNQIVHVRVFWRPRPGTTYAEQTQTNANITYVLQRGSDAIAYEGAGFVTFKESAFGSAVSGQIESSSLAPARRVGRSEDLLGRCQLRGPFVAREDRREVVTRVQGMRRVLGGRGRE